LIAFKFTLFKLKEVFIHFPDSYIFTKYTTKYEKYVFKYCKQQVFNLRPQSYYSVIWPGVAQVKYKLFREGFWSLNYNKRS